jgi:hypothetical protein
MKIKVPVAAISLAAAAAGAFAANGNAPFSRNITCFDRFSVGSLFDSMSPTGLAAGTYDFPFSPREQFFNDLNVLAHSVAATTQYFGAGNEYFISFADIAACSDPLLVSMSGNANSALTDLSVEDSAALGLGAVALALSGLGLIGFLRGRRLPSQ